MRFVTIINLFVASTLVSSLPVTQRDAPAVLSDISTLSNCVSTLTADVGSYIGSEYQNSALVTAFENLKSEIETATSDTTASPLFTSDESQSIVDAVQNMTSPVITLLIDIKAKAPTVASMGYTEPVYDALEALNDDTIDLFSALENVVVIKSVAALSPSQQQIAAAFSDAIAAYTQSAPE